MAWLKALVIGMGVLIVGGVVALAVLMVNRVGGGAMSAPSTAVAARIELPAGARIAETHVDGKTLLLRLTMPDGSSRIALYETSGKLISMIEVVETK